MWMSCLTTWLLVTWMPLVLAVPQRILVIRSIQVYRTNPNISISPRVKLRTTKIQLTWVTPNYMVLYFLGTGKSKLLNAFADTIKRTAWIVEFKPDSMSARVICHFASLLRNDCSDNHKHSYCGQVYSPRPSPQPITTHSEDYDKVGSVLWSIQYIASNILSRAALCMGF